MNSTLRNKAIFVLVIILICVYGIIGIPKSGAELVKNWNENIRLGLDLKGGSQLVLQVQVQDAFKAKNVLFVKADYTAAPPDISAALKKMGRAGVPLYVLFRKRGDYWISESLSQSGLLEQINKL